MTGTPGTAPIPSTRFTLEVEIQPLREWYEMRLRDEGGVHLVDRDGDPEYRSTENAGVGDIAEALQHHLVGRDLDGMWSVRSVTAPADVKADIAHDPKLGIAQAILAMDYEAAEELAEITIGALAVVWRAINRSTIKAGAGAMDDEELYRVVCKGVDKMLASEGGYETALVLLRALMARQIKAEAAR